MMDAAIQEQWMWGGIGGKENLASAVPECVENEAILTKY